MRTQELQVRPGWCLSRLKIRRPTFVNITIVTHFPPTKICFSFFSVVLIFVATCSFDIYLFNVCCLQHRLLLLLLATGGGAATAAVAV